MRIRITEGNVKRYKESYYAQSCVECGDDIPIGKPFGNIDQIGPYCANCLSDHGHRAEIEVNPKPQSS